MTNPVLVEVLRGDLVEGRHRGAIAVSDSDGKLVLEIGDCDIPVFPRSAVKAIQALPLVESGAADAFGFSNREIALACSSHTGEPEHTSLALAMLRKAGLDESALECGAHWPSRQRATIDLARVAEMPCQWHNNCSGKHAGFLCTCVHAGIDRQGYVAASHPMQELVREAMEDVTGAHHNAAMRGTDGCSIPTYAVPLRSLARGFARMSTGDGLKPQRAGSAKRILAACMAEPFLVAGTGRSDTRMMEAGKGRVFTKMGAEGVFCAALPNAGLGIALKCDDGAGRAADVMIAETIARLLGEKDELAPVFREMARPELRNWKGLSVASLRPTEVLESASA